jgi:hypothetical protein
LFTIFLSLLRLLKKNIEKQLAIKYMGLQTK